MSDLHLTVILVGMTHRVGPKGQVVIPKDLRDELGIEAGDEVSIWRHDDHVAVRPTSSTANVQSCPGSISAMSTMWSAVCAARDLIDAAALAISKDAVLWTGDPELLVEGAPWQWKDLRPSGTGT